MKKGLLVYWITTGILLLYQGVLTALTAQTEMVLESFTHLGYPSYFGTALSIAKVLGAVALILPQVPRQVKEWAYAGFFFDFIFASISLWAVNGFSLPVLFPLLVLAVLMISYFSYHKMYSVPLTSTPDGK